MKTKTKGGIKEQKLVKSSLEEGRRRKDRRKEPPLISN